MRVEVGEVGEVGEGVRGGRVGEGLRWSEVGDVGEANLESMVHLGKGLLLGRGGAMAVGW